MKILIATKNPGKFEEIRSMLEDLPVDFVSLEELGILEDFVEEEGSFEDNALGKARFFSQRTGLPALADDSGIFVEALADELGVKTRRWGAGEQASDEEWLAHFMKRMEAESNRKAEFVCAAAYVNGKEEKVFKGETLGFILEAPAAPLKPGIPLSSVFKPETAEQVYAALSTQEKNRLSHRGKAFTLLKTYLQNHA